ncbi:MAG TPA: ribosomal protein L7/L12 [Burkholderiaceae bacterium]
MSIDPLYLALGALVVALLGLQRISARLAKIENLLAQLIKHHGLEPAPLPTPSAEVLALALAGDKIKAIKAYREQSGAGLKDAKDMIEKHTG